MSNEYSVDDLLGFLEHAADRGLMPPATATALGVACRTVFKVLSEDEKGDVRKLDLGSVAKRFHNKHAKDFSGATLKEYERRVRRAVGLFGSWRDDPANFRAPTRMTSGKRSRKEAEPETESEAPVAGSGISAPPPLPGTYQTTLPLGPGRIVTLLNVPSDLTESEAERLATFVRMLAVASGA